MDAGTAERLFGALSTASRVEILRLLSKAGREGLPSGEIARQLDMVQNTLSTQLNLLAGAGLVERQREGRNIIYRTKPKTFADLISFLAKECGGGIKVTAKVPS
jgi:DNA-binding transcriptional ArsR family regulator